MVQESVSKIERPTPDEYFMEIARVVASRSTCLRQKVGAVIVRDKRILATGYNGAPTGMPHCLDIGCLREQLKVPSGERQELCRAVHAEQNAIIQAAVHGVSIANATLYTTHQPCIMCAKMIINAGIKRVVYGKKYADERGLEFLREAGIEVVYIPLEMKRGAANNRAECELDRNPPDEPPSKLTVDELAGIRLKKPIVLDVERDVLCLKNEELELYGCGETIEEALKDLSVVFESLIEEYLKESDEVLSKKALELKRKLQEHVEVCRSV